MKNSKLNQANPIIRDSIGQTLLIPLYMKYLESQKSDPIISDKVACDLVKRIDFDFAKYDQSNSSSVIVAIRANYFDQMLKSFIRRSQNPIILIIGCGLDSRYDRIEELSAQALFYQLDIPEVIEIRKQFIPARENETYLSSSMLETEWMDTLSQEHPNGQFMFIVEGVFMYFSKENVQSVFLNLSKRFAKSELLFDILNVWMSNNTNLHDAIKLTNAKFRYGTDDDKEMEKWADNLELTSSRLFTDFKEGARLGAEESIIQAGKMLNYRIN